MPWSDIDFENTLIKGMITRQVDRQNTVSFTEYLNTFSRALDEKYNMVTQYPKDDILVLPNIVFEMGEIRATQEFWDKYRSLISGYYDLYDSYTWYKDSALDNRSEVENHELEDSDIVGVIGQEVFDIISDVDNQANYNLFRADVLNGIYQLYILLKLKATAKQVANTRDDQDINLINVFRLDSDPLWGFSGRGTGGTESDANSDYNSDLTSGFSNNGNINNFYQVSELLTGFDGLSYIKESSVSTNSEFYLLSKDLGNNNLSMDYYACNVPIIRNTKIVSTTSGTTNPEAYDFNFPFVKFGDLPVNFFLDPHEVVQGQSGTRNSYILLDSRESTNIDFYSYPSDVGSNNARFDVSSSAIFLVDVNNSALEFSI